jgi:peptide/nickel transport system permease protein
MMGLALVGLSVPNFLLGLVMILVFGVWLGWLPVAGYVPLDDGIWPNLRSLLMPSLALGLVQSALIARITRSSMLDVLREQFVLTGRAKGLSERVVVYKHALKNAIIPTLTVIGILRRDYPVIQGVVLLIALTYTAVNLLVDLAYLAVDPRVRYQ